MRWLLSVVIVLVMAGMTLSDGLPTYLPKVLSHEDTVLEDGEIVIIVTESGLPVGIGVGFNGKMVPLVDSRVTFAGTPDKMLDPTDYTIVLGGSAYRSGNSYQMFHPTTNTAPDFGTITITVNDPYEVKNVEFRTMGWEFSTAESYSEDGKSYILTATKDANFGIGLATSEVWITSVEAWVYDNSGRTNDIRGTKNYIDHPFAVDPSYALDDDYSQPLTWGGYKTIVAEDVSQWASHEATNRVMVRNGMRFDDGISLQQSFDISYKNNGFLKIQYRDSAGGLTKVISAENLDAYPCIVNFPDSNRAEVIWTTNGISGGSYVIQCSTNYPDGVWSNAVEVATNAAQDGYLSRTVINPFGENSYYPTYWRVMAVGVTVADPVLKTDLPFSASSYQVGGSPALFMSGAKVLKIQQRTSSGQGGGDLHPGAFTNRVLNTMVFNYIDGATTNQGGAMIPAGTYWIDFWATACDVDSHVACIIQDGTITNIMGSAGSCAPTEVGIQNQSFGSGIIVMTNTATLKLYHKIQQVNSVYAGGGYDGGYSTIGETNIFADMTIWKLN
jgi:hypothetical protein